MSMPPISVLYVDDEPSNLTVFIASFRRYYTVYTASSAVEGIAILKKYPVQLVLADQRMPDMSGIQFLEAVMADHPHIIRIILTGFADMDAIIEAINKGKVYCCITKPWEDRELKATLDSAARTFYLEKYNRERIQKLEEQLIEQERILNLYKRFTPTHLEADILDSINFNLIGGQLRIVSLLFIEILNSSTLFRGLEPKNALLLFNSYLAFVEKKVIKNKGTVHRSIGGKLMVAFGAPVSFIDNPKNAFLCALEVLKEIENFNAKNNTSITLALLAHTGSVIVGNTPFDSHLEYTIIGDAVEVLEQLLSIKKANLNSLLISEDMYKTLSSYDLSVTASSKEKINVNHTNLTFYVVDYLKTIRQLGLTTDD